MMDFSDLEEFHCTICDQLFDSDERCPKMLSCGHSFCLACLNKFFPSSPSCPTCKTDIQYTSVDLIPVNLLIKSCVTNINVQSGVKRKDIAEHEEANDSTSIELDAKRKKLVSVGFCDEHENFKEFRCMNCDAWICSMCATLNHKKCNTLLVEEAFKEIQKKSDQMIASQLDIRKSRLAIILKSLKAVEEKKESLEQDIQDLKLKIEAKLAEIKDQDIEYDKLQNIIVEEKKLCVKLKEIQLLTKSSLCDENLEKLLEAKQELETLCQQSKSDLKHIYSIPEQSDKNHQFGRNLTEYNDESSELEEYLLQSDEVEIVTDSKDSDFVQNKINKTKDSGPMMAAESSNGTSAWNRSRVLLVGDSQLRHLMNNPDPTQSLNVDYAARKGAKVDDLISFVDKFLSPIHSVLIIMGFMDENIFMVPQPISPFQSTDLVKIDEVFPVCEIIIAKVRTAHMRWRKQFPNLIILWTIPYYLDIVSYNCTKMHLANIPFDAAALLMNSHLYAHRFVKFVNSLKTLWMSELFPDIQVKHFNDVLFSGSNNWSKLSTFTDLSDHFDFPKGLLSDGLHPTPLMVGKIWKMLYEWTIIEDRRMTSYQ